MGRKTANEVRALEVAKSPNPEPIDLLNNLGAGPEWNADHWPSPVAGFAIDVAERTGCDPTVPCSAIIASVCALADDRVRLQVKKNDDTWLEGPREWLMISALPSAKKTPGQKEPMAEVFRVQKDWNEEYHRALDAYEIEAEVYKKQRSEYIKKRAKGEPCEKPTAPVKPAWKRAVITDATIEALCDILKDNPQGVLSYQDELSGWFGAMDAYRGKGVSKDRGDWLKAYNGGPHVVDRVSKGTRHIPNWSSAIIGGIQPEKLREIAGRLDDDGLIQRFLIMPARPASNGVDRCPGSRQPWRNILESLIRLEGPKVITLSPEAQEVINEARATIHTLGKNPAFSMGLQTALQKFEGHLARLTLIFHLVEVTTTDPVRLETARRAVRAVLEYFVPCAIWFHQNFLATSPTDKTMRRLAGWLLAERKDTVTRRDIYRAQRELTGDEGGRTLDRIMDTLDLSGWVEIVKRDKRNQPNTWKVNPRVHELFVERAEAERKRRKEEVHKIQACAAERQKHKIDNA